MPLMESVTSDRLSRRASHSSSVVLRSPVLPPTCSDWRLWLKRKAVKMAAHPFLSSPVWPKSIDSSVGALTPCRVNVHVSSCLPFALQLLTDGWGMRSAASRSPTFEPSLQCRRLMEVGLPWAATSSKSALTPVKVTRVRLRTSSSSGQAAPKRRWSVDESSLSPSSLIGL